MLLFKQWKAVWIVNSLSSADSEGSLYRGAASISDGIFYKELVAEEACEPGRDGGRGAERGDQLRQSSPKPKANLEKLQVIVQCLAYDDQYNAPWTDLELIHCVTPDSGFLTLKRHFKIVYEDGYKKDIHRWNWSCLAFQDTPCKRERLWKDSHLAQGAQNEMCNRKDFRAPVAFIAQKVSDRRPSQC